MKLKNIIIFFPNFSRGGIEKTSLLLSNFFARSDIKIQFISFNKVNKKKYKFSKKINFNYKDNTFFLSENLYCTYLLFKILLNKDKQNTVILSFQNSILSIIVSKLLGFKIVVRSAAPIDYFKRKNLFLDKVKLFFKMKIYSYSDLIISNSKSSAKKIKEKLKTKRRIISIPNPISKLETRINKTQKKDQILYVGRLSNEKGLFKLIEGFEIFNKDFPYYKLKIVGDGNQRNNLIEFIKSKKINKAINLIGWRSNINKFYKSSKVLILPSFFEGFGNVLIEALNFNLPCIATNNDGPKEILGYGKFGLLMRDNSANTINLSLRYLIKNYNIYKLKAIRGFKNNHNYHINKIGKKYFLEINSVLR